MPCRPRRRRTGPCGDRGRRRRILLREARQLGAAARADLAGAKSKPDDVADLLSLAGDLVARAARDRGDSVEPSTDVPDYDDDSANEEPTDSESDDDSRSRRARRGKEGYL